MLIQNKFKKFSLGISSLFLVVLLSLGIKIKEDDKKIGKLEEEISGYNAEVAAFLEMQKKIMASRESILDKIADAPAPDTTKTVTVKTVIPGKVVQQKVPASSDNKTRTS